MAFLDIFNSVTIFNINNCRGRKISCYLVQNIIGKFPCKTIKHFSSSTIKRIFTLQNRYLLGDLDNENQ